ncbi:hypothetical protein CMI37_31605 [Candidatus Pacearchaeota archaeon]|nr:hypothetical protein [Candidatus Pacearchaeota archaeon]
MSDAVNRPRLLDLFCGAGGCSVGYHRAGFDVVGVDINPQPNYPFEFHQADAMEFPLDGFDAIHASPPCQAHSVLGKMVKNERNEYPDLIAATRVRLRQYGRPWVIENVEGAPMDLGTWPLFTTESGIVLCGSMFGLNNGEYELRRHRLFESSETLWQPKCNHHLPVIGFYGDHARTRKRVVGSKDRGRDIVGKDRKMPLVRDLMGIDWMTWHEATQAIPPAYTEWIGRRIIDAIQTTERGTQTRLEP